MNATYLLNLSVTLMTESNSSGDEVFERFRMKLIMMM